MVGFCIEEINPFGPFHKYEAPEMFEAVKERVDPWHSGLLLRMFGAGGIGLTIATLLLAGLVHPFTVAVNE